LFPTYVEHVQIPVVVVDFSQTVLGEPELLDPFDPPELLEPLLLEPLVPLPGPFFVVHAAATPMTKKSAANRANEPERSCM
jgi:hypothetical protein